MIAGMSRYQPGLGDATATILTNFFERPSPEIRRFAIITTPRPGARYRGAVTLEMPAKTAELEGGTRGSMDRVPANTQGIRGEQRDAITSNLEELQT